MDQTLDNKTDRAPWGEGRIAYAAHAQRIELFITQGWPLKKIYRELESQLNGLSYQQFTYHVRRQEKRKKPTPTQNKITSPIEDQDRLTPGGEDEQTQTPKRAGKPTRFQPGPRIPDPSQLY
jgi:hypothetical protein